MSKITIIKCVEWLVTLLLFSLATLWGVDHFYKPLDLKQFQWLIIELRPLNSFEILVLPFTLTFFKLFAKRKELIQEKQKLNSGRLSTSARCQTMMINPIQVGENLMLLLHWVQSIKVGPNQLLDFCGGQIGRDAYVRMMEASLSEPATPLPLIETREARIALSEFEASHSAARRIASAVNNPMLIVHAAEDSGRIIQPRVFEIPPAMLLLFMKKEFHLNLVTTRDFHYDRALALDSIAHQVLGASEEMPNIGDFRPCYAYCVRDITVSAQDMGFDWWDARWHIEIGRSYQEVELEQKRAALIAALMKAAPVTKPNFYLVRDAVGFIAKLTNLKKLQQTLPKALQM